MSAWDSISSAAYHSEDNILLIRLLYYFHHCLDYQIGLRIDIKLHFLMTVSIAKYMEYNYIADYGVERFSSEITLEIMFRNNKTAP